MLDPRELLQRAAAGDEAAWREIVQRYQRLVFSTIRSFRLPHAEAEDLFQETFLRLHRHAARIDDPNRLVRWLIVTARNLCLDHLARRKTAARANEIMDRPEPAETRADELLRIEREIELREALAELPERCQKLLHSLYFEQETPDYQKTARDLGMPIGSIGPTRGRCLEQLLRRLQIRQSRREEP